LGTSWPPTNSIAEPGEPLPLAWQWNHNPDHRYWSIGERSGHLRLVTGRVDSDVLQARNMLTQRTFGPVSSATTKIEVGHMKDGDCAGLIALQRDTASSASGWKATASRSSW
jgi:beta-xylosidase